MKAKRMSRGLVSVTVAFSLAAAIGHAAAAERSGKEVVEAVCIACHGSGKDGAPRIDDRAAWAKRAAQGLDQVTEHAITGYRKMPAHGGQPELSDLEISRGIAYMVSGGHAVDPIKPYSSPLHLSGEQIVQARCQECHGSGTDGAPRIGDMAAWKPRLASGLDALVQSAIRGHGGMPARGGLAQLSDAELKAAVTFMIHQSAAATLKP